VASTNRRENRYCQAANHDNFRQYEPCPVVVRFERTKLLRTTAQLARWAQERVGAALQHFLFDRRPSCRPRKNRKPGMTKLGKAGLYASVQRPSTIFVSLYGFLLISEPPHHQKLRLACRMTPSDCGWRESGRRRKIPAFGAIGRSGLLWSGKN